MPRTVSALLLVLVTLFVLTAGAAQTNSGSPQIINKHAAELTLRKQRSSPLDLEISGALTGLPLGTTRYLTREDLLVLPQVNLTVSDDPNFAGPANVQGVELQRLAREVAREGERAVIVAVCIDQYRSYYPQGYREAHRPVLALEINGQPPSGWPKRKNTAGSSLGPYLITQPRFTPAFKILAHADEAQIPWGVIRLEFRNEESAFRAVAPRGPNASDAAVQAGFGIAKQNCLRCHGPESDEPLKGKLTWAGIAVFASQAPKNFAAYVRNPQALAKDAEMPANPEYDDTTLDALIAYFKSFAGAGKR